MGRNKLISVKNVKGGFWQFWDHPVVSKIWADYSAGITTVYYTNGSIRSLHAKCTGYNSQYGTPVSDDGSKLFVGAWEKTLGLTCYSIEQDSVIWQMKRPKIRQIFCFDDYLVALEAQGALYKINIQDGKTVARIDNGALEDQFCLSEHTVFVNSIGKEACVINTQTMQNVKKYPRSVLNPRGCISFTLNRVELSGGRLMIYGFECIANDTQSGRLSMEPYTRIIDENASEGYV